MKNTFCALLILQILNSNVYLQNNPTVESIIQQVTLDSLYDHLRIITGDKSFYSTEGEFTIVSRYANNVANQYAADYLYEKLNSYGLETFRQNFNWNGQNVYAIHYGEERNQYVMLCAHYDDMPYGNFAPGADDNGSGTAAVIESARILSNYSFEYSIIFALWDQEEQGLIGSDNYAQLAGDRGDSILAVINLDMIGWDSNNDNILEIHTQDYNLSSWLAKYVRDINTDYNIGLVTQIIDPGATASDHYSFWLRNYSAILLIEDYITNQNGTSDFNAFYHTTLDNLNGINQNYFFKNTKLGIGSAASLAFGDNLFTDTNDIVIPSKYILYQNYPNPFNPSTTIKYELPKSGFVTLKIFDILGNEIATLVNENQETGIHFTEFDIKDFDYASGIYFYALYVDNFSAVRKMVLTK